MTLLWKTSEDGTETAEKDGIQYWIFRAPPTSRIARNYALRIEFDRNGAWIRSDDVMDDANSPTICKEQAEKIAARIASLLASKAQAALPGWVSVEESMPDNRDYVLAYMPGQEVGRAWFCEENKHWILGGYDVGTSAITHWSPLPPPPTNPTKEMNE